MIFADKLEKTLTHTKVINKLKTVNYKSDRDQNGLG